VKVVLPRFNRQKQLEPICAFPALLDMNGEFALSESHRKSATTELIAPASKLKLLDILEKLMETFEPSEPESASR